MTKISFFGASVTQQKNGYVDRFNNKFINLIPDIDVKKYGYGQLDLY